MIKLITIVGAIVLLFTLIVLWRIFLMPTIENSSYICSLYTPEEYKEILSYDDFSLADLASTETVQLELEIEFPFSIPENAILLVEMIFLGERTNLYLDRIPLSSRINFHIPPPSTYPKVYTWNFHLLIPSKSAICSWGLEEDMYLMDENFPRSWRIKLLTERFAKGDGGERTTIFEPL